MNNDLISRKQAIDAILHITNCKSVRELFEYNQAHHLTEMWSGGVNDAIDAVIGVESATDKKVGTTDTINRQQAIDAVTDELDVIDHVPQWVFDRLEGRLKQLPPVTPKQRTGRWERHYSRPNVYADLFWHCSECGYKNNDDYAPTYHKFCPNCGIKMIQTDKTCDCYSDGRCVGTKEIDLCSCGGNKSKCDFYENVRREGGAE